MTSFNNSSDTGENQGEQSQGATFGANGADNDQSRSRGDEGGNQSVEEQLKVVQKRLEDSQNFIETLKSETANYRQEIDQLKTGQTTVNIDEIVEKVNQARGNNDQTVNVEDLVNQAVQRTTETLSAKEQQQKEEANFKEVSELFAKQFGSEVDVKVSALAAENDMTFDEAVQMARQKPKTLLKLFGIKVGESTPTPTSSTLNSQALGTTLPPSPSQRKNIMEARTDRERIEIAKQKMKEHGLGMYNV